jgi:ketosteroid isomerase-like protein
MKIACIALLVCLVILPQPGWTADEQTQPKLASRATERTVLQALEHRWLQALFSLDLTTITSEEGEEFTFITPAMVFTRQTHLMSVKQSLVQGTPPASPVVFDVTNQKIEIYGDTVLLTDLISVQDTDSDAGITGGRYWQTEVWRRVDGNWKIVHMHISILKHGM